MKINEILFEDKISTITEQATKVATFIKKNCQPWLVQTDNGYYRVFRGTRNFPQDTYFIKDIRTDRTPTDSSPEKHALYNTLIASINGVANRSNSMFVNSHLDTARTYGKPFVVIPVGNFHYTWSPKYYDWTNDLGTGRILSYLKDSKKIEEFILYGDSLTFNTLEKNGLLDPNSYNRSLLNNDIICDNDLLKAIQTGNEIMISCKSAIYINLFLYNLAVAPILNKQQLDPEKIMLIPNHN